MEQRIEFGLRALEGGNFRALCREYGIPCPEPGAYTMSWLRPGIGYLLPVISHLLSVNRRYPTRCVACRAGASRVGG